MINFIFLITAAQTVLADGWSVDLSRRFPETPPPAESTSPVAETTKSRPFLEKIFSQPADLPTQEIVILQTEKGFVPSKIQVRQGGSYKLDVVNVNEKEKNVSFILDAFSEHHATYYGKIKSFTIQPAQEGIYTFQSPETAFQGQLVVLPTEVTHSDPDVRAPAAEN